ncbi:DUF4886 domain-containing protein [Candidatus Nanohalovita haloferacivicina]|uniref:DUF4886 domain-containing protein n=1 Tax=Candidatus Nanohalovita haloferacivicina TaxID=2978046 RepID=UPI00325FDE40
MVLFVLEGAVLFVSDFSFGSEPEVETPDADAANNPSENVSTTSVSDEDDNSSESDRRPDSNELNSSSVEGEAVENESINSSDEADPRPVENVSTLFVGNSYTDRNDLPVLYRSVVGSTSNFSESSVTVDSVTYGGYRLREHASDLESGGRISSVLGDDWDYVVLQEQSQIIGFSLDHEERIKSMDAGERLSQAVNRSGADTVLFMTWGRRDGDERNRFIYPNYTAMQKYLRGGYEQMRYRVRDNGSEASIAPVGMAFKEAYDYSSRDGPANRTGTVFYDLYASDGSHPSVQGSYLAALVIGATSTGVEPLNVSYRPSEVSSSRADLLKGFASSAADYY